jgi:glycosyltransferase involved in cell wall biosynthesis
LDVSVVIPVFDEEGAVADVVAGWDAMLRDLGVAYELRVYDDGSRDRTPAILDALTTAHAALVVVHQANRGHGPTVLRAYHEATGDFVFQVDGDDEMSPAAFPGFWARRDAADLLLGIRVHGGRPRGRRFISAVSRLAVRALFGRGVSDVNVPYRLHRRSALQRLLPLVPGDTFAPNLILAGHALRAGLRVVEMPVPARMRRTGESSFGTWRMWKSAARALTQTIAVAYRSRTLLRTA